MKHRLMVPFLVLLLIALYAPMAEASTLIDSYASTNRDDFIGLDDTHPSAGATSAAGQSFTNLGYYARITSVKFYLQTPGAPDGNLIAALYTHSGTYGSSSVPTGAPLAVSDPIAANTITGGYVLREFYFTGANRYLMQPDTKYCIAVYRTATVNSISVGTDQTAPGHAGNAFKYTSGAWEAVATEDTIFYVYSNVFGSGDGTYKFYFDNAVYENNTDASQVVVTTNTGGTSEDFPIDDATWYYSTLMPSYFTWEVSAGIYRRIYVDGEENFTITLPEDSFTSFGFTIKDFTGESSTGDLMFETRRVIGGSERIIERIPVVQTINLITCTLVANRNYVVQLTVGTTTYRYTFFSSTVDTTPTIVLNTISFSRTIQISSKYVYVDADRPTTTSLRVNYTNSRADTNSVQVRIREMDGTLINSTTIGTDTFTYTYSPVDNETSYYFDLIIDTDTFSHLTWRKTLPWEPTFSNVPDPFTLLGTVGALDTSRIFGFMIILFTALLFSAKDVSIGCFSVALTTALMNYWGFFPVPLPILAVVIGLSVLIGLGLRGR